MELYGGYFLAGAIFCAIVGSIFSLPSVWRYFFKPNTPTYLRAGEYGESELNHSHWSPWKEPLNAWSSLAYSFFGFVVLFTGLGDLIYGNPVPKNDYSVNPGFSILNGLAFVWLGVSSFLFHASHAEPWRKADAGMTTGVMASSLAFGVWDRARPAGVGPWTMVVCATIFQFSLTHGYLPYGSSDALLPTLIAACWCLELLPRYGGVVDQIQYKYWLQACFGAIGGMLLRAADIKRHSPKVYNYLIQGYFAVLLLFGYFNGYFDVITLCAMFGGLLVAKYPEKGHICWHVFSSYALFIWWYQLRVRSADPVMVSNGETQLIGMAFFMVVKNAVRRIFMALPFQSNDMRNRVMFFCEHLFFTVWGWHVLVMVPGEKDSWFEHPMLCFVKPSFPFDLFHLYYQVKVATHCEDLVYIGVQYFIEQKPAPSDAADVSVEKRSGRDVKMDIHHIVTAALCFSSYVSGYAKIGSIVMILHDASDVPLDMLRIASSLNTSTFVQSSVFITTVLSWIYWRLWIFPSKVLYTIAFESKSFHFPSSCVPGSCNWAESPERGPFLLFLGTLQVLHVIWFFLLLKKGYKALFCAPANVSEI